MKRVLLAAAALFTLFALAGAVGMPDFAGAQDAADGTDTVTVTGVGSVETVPNEAQMSFGVETRRPTAKAAVAANAEEMRKVINALRQARGREIATQWVSVYPVSNEQGVVDGYSASNSVSVTSDVDDAAALIDAAVEAGANQVSGPGLSRSDSEELYRAALGKAVAEARARAEVLAKAAGRSLGPITSISESSAAPPYPYAERAALDAAATPIVPGEQGTTASITVTFSLR